MGVPELLAHDQIHTVTYNLNFTHFGGAAIASQAFGVREKADNTSNGASTKCYFVFCQPLTTYFRKG